MRKGRPLIAAVALLALASAVGCSAHPDSAATTDPGTSAVPATDRSTPATVSTTRGPTTAAETNTGTSRSSFNADQESVATAYNEANQAYAHAAAVSDPSDPTFEASFDPQYLHELQILIQQRKDSGQAVRDAQPSKAKTTVVSVIVTPPTATLVTCEVDDRVVYRTADGSDVNSSVSTDRWSVVMTTADGTWKVSGRHQLQTWDGEVMNQCLAAQ